MKRKDFFNLGLERIGAAPVVENAPALKYYPMPSEEKCAVMYGTWCGSCRDATVWVSEGMGGFL